MAAVSVAHGTKPLFYMGASSEDLWEGKFCLNFFFRTVNWLVPIYMPPYLWWYQPKPVWAGYLKPTFELGKDICFQHWHSVRHSAEKFSCALHLVWHSMEHHWVLRLWQQDNIKVTAVNHACCSGLKSFLCLMNRARVSSCAVITTQGSWQRET